MTQRTAHERRIGLLERAGEVNLARLLKSCHAQCTNINGCLHVCPNGQSRLRHRRVQQARLLIEHYGPPFYRIRYARVNFSPPAGELHTVQLVAFRRLQKHFYSSLPVNRIGAVGLLKAALNPGLERWMCEADELVAGCDISEVKQRFAKEEIGGLLMIKAVRDLEADLHRVFRDRLERLENGKYVRAADANFDLRVEHVRWKRATGSSRLFLYGCDRDFRPRSTLVKFQHRRRPREEKPERIPAPPGYYRLD